MHEELIPVIDKLEHAVAERDALEIIAVLSVLHETFIYSGNEVYDRFGKVKTKMIAVLFETVDITEFCQLFLNSNKIYPSDIWAALETIVDKVSFDALWTVKDYYGLPGSIWTPKLYALLSDEPNVEISKELIDAIERLAVHESQAGTKFSEHEARMSTFRYIRWLPSDGGLSDVVRLLGSRHDPVSLAACEKYLRKPPWGADRGATVSLLDGISKGKSAEHLALLRHTLSFHQEPLMLRMWIWRALFYIDPTEAVLGVMKDFDRYKKSDDLILLIEFLGNLLHNLRTEKKEFDEDRVIVAAENVNTSRWSFVASGYYGTMLRILLPKSDYRKKSGPSGRGFVAVSRIWDWIQIDHMGCAGPLLWMFGITFFFLWGLDFLLGRPSEGTIYIPSALFAAWIFWAIVNIQTHFSGQKTIVQKFFAVVIYFGTLISAIAASIIIRL